MNRRHALQPLLLALAAAGIALPAAAEKINVNDNVKKAINADAKALAALKARVGGNVFNGTVSNVAIKTLKPGTMQIQMPPFKFEYITSTEIINCAATATQREVKLGKEVTNSMTVTKSDTLDIGTEVSVSADFFGVSASTKVSTNYSMTNEQSKTDTKTDRVEDTTTVAFNDTGGRISVLQAKKMQGSKIPWTATFIPGDDDEIEFTVTANVTPRGCVFEHKNYDGGKYCGNGTVNHMRDVGFDDVASSVQVDSGSILTLCEHPGKGGRCKDYRSGMTWWIGDDFNDRVSYFSVRPESQTAKVKWGQIKDAMPAGAKQFIVKGAMDVSLTSFEDKRVINYEMKKEDVAETCGLGPTGGGMAAMQAPKPASAPAPVQASSVQAARAPAPVQAAAPAMARPTSQQAAAGLHIKPLTDAELQKKLAGAKPL